MKSALKYILLVTGVSLVIAACNKVDDLPLYGNGTAPVLTASSATVAPLPADSNNVALTLSWTDPLYAATKYKYTVEIDSAGKGFAKATSKTVSDTLKTSFTAKELNTMLLGYGYAFGVPVDMEVRVTSSYANNNERLTSNTVRIKMTPYKIPPKVALPASTRLFIVGDATTFGWTNDATPAFPAAREFARLNETTWAGIFYMNGSGAYKVLQTQGAWNTQFHMVAGGSSATGSFIQEDADPGFPSPAAAGWYRLSFDFQTGKYAVTPYTGTLPTANLYIVGDATAWGWNNPVPAPLQQFTRVNSSVWELTMPLIGGKEYLVLTTNGDWGKKYALKDNSITGIAAGGEFGYHQDGQATPDDYKNNFKGPVASGTYKMSLNFAAATATAGASGKFTVQ